MMRANVEKTYDRYEEMAVSAMMQRKANNAKRVKQSDLFKRPIDESKAEKEMAEMKGKAESASEWLGQFSQFNGKLSS